MNFINSKNFLMYVGWILLVLGVVGFFFPNIGGGYLNFDSAENWAHTLLGVVALAIVYVVKDMKIVRWVAIVYALVALLFGVWGFIVAGNPSPNFYNVSNLETLDNLLHLVVGVWGVWATFFGL